MNRKSPLHWKKILLCGAASLLIGIALSLLGAVASHTLLGGDETTGIWVVLILTITVVPVTAAIAWTLPLVFVRERRLAHSLATVAVAVSLLVLLVWWFVFYSG